MQDERFVELLVKLHAGLPRLGPGNEASTLKALALCEQLPERPEILDIGCGTGGTDPAFGHCHTGSSYCG